VHRKERGFFSGSNNEGASHGNIRALDARVNQIL
jgi:hypothetical protein